MRRVLYIVLPLLLLVWVGCYPSFERWLELMPGQEGVVTYDTWCGDPGEEWPEWDEAIATWERQGWLVANFGGDIFQKKQRPYCGDVTFEMGGCGGAPACARMWDYVKDGY